MAAAIQALQPGGPDVGALEAGRHRGPVDHRGVDRRVGPEGVQLLDHLLGTAVLGEALVDDRDRRARHPPVVVEAGSLSL